MAGALLSGAATAPGLRLAPKILVFDSGLGGLTVLEQVRRARPDAAYVYAADDAAFPYGRLSEEALIERVLAVMGRLIATHAPDLVVVACNTASTLVLPALRDRYATPFVGVVPPIKPAAEATRSRAISLLATPGTVSRAYTHELIETYAGGCDVTLVGAPSLAGFAEAEMAGLPIDDRRLAAEIAPCFVTAPTGRRTDVICLACTHYPLLISRFQALAPWPVTWIDPAPAIARRVVQLLGPAPRGPIDEVPVLAAFTAGSGLNEPLRRSLAARGARDVVVDAMPLAH